MGASTRASYRRQQHEAQLTLSIEDDGPGIAPEQAQHVLERGARADQSVPGQGIGLAVVRDIVDAYDGRIEIGRSELGGAAVSVALPIAPSP